ncbi:MULTISPECIES: LolA-like protein [Streptomyces]|uniref:hypothetical protein n=1 Tax=Streptomyces TaxID=1883 RepID=UPI00163C2CC6|nr:MULTISPECIES: hypothetical protein [Streptomyces]MBC2878214.1 hypothetical protein [Streptomyces sp. TYQ1024]UBI39710.1 hypothetical protein K7I03_26735 [Streptomyces mobaraensis]UKW32290.1 hypothetical protein MCU78_26670 [Streptomyces sp. TYQ1024]
MKALKKYVMAATGTALALSLTACGGGEKEDDRDPQAVLKAAAEKTAGANSYRTKRQVTEVDGTERGEYSFSRKPDLAERKTWRTRTKDGKKEPERFAHAMSKDQTLYTRDAKIADGRWVSSSLLAAGEEPPKPEDVQKTAEGSLPKLLGVLRTSKDVRKVGREKVNGHKTTHFAGTVVLADLAAYKGDVMRDWLRELYVEKHRKDGLEKVDIDLWIGEDDLPVKGAEHGKGSKGSTGVTEEYAEFGADPGIRIPKGKDVVTEDAWLQEVRDKAYRGIDPVS